MTTCNAMCVGAKLFSLHVPLKDCGTPHLVLQAGPAAAQAYKPCQAVRLLQLPIHLLRAACQRLETNFWERSGSSAADMALGHICKHCWPPETPMQSTRYMLA